MMFLCHSNSMGSLNHQNIALHAESNDFLGLHFAIFVLSSANEFSEQKAMYTLIQNLELSVTELNAIIRQSAAHTATSSCSKQAIGLAPGFNSLVKNSLNVCQKGF